MEASFIGADAELQPRRRLIPLDRQPLELPPRGGVKTAAIVQQNAAQQPPRRRPRLKRRVQAAELALTRAARTSLDDQRRPPPHAQPKTDRTADGDGGGRSWESGVGVGEATVHSTIRDGAAD